MVKYYSDMTHKYYNSAEAAQQAEEEILNATKRREEEKTAALESLRTHFNEVEDIRASANTAIKDYSKARQDFGKQLTEFHKRYGYVPDDYKNYNPLTMFFNW